ncbi:MAG: DUF3387 domain-containing protein, partial [Bacteroidales bacterium]|nr:DUF3387 domain-containing protein [Bacteroidales bacterium]
RYGFLSQYTEEQYIEMAQAVKEKVDDSSQFIDWEKRTDIRAQLKVQIILTLAKFKYPPATRDEVFKAILEQAENFMKNRGEEDEHEQKHNEVRIYQQNEEWTELMAAESAPEYGDR